MHLEVTAGVDMEQWSHPRAHDDFVEDWMKMLWRMALRDVMAVYGKIWSADSPSMPVHPLEIGFRDGDE